MKSERVLARILLLGTLLVSITAPGARAACSNAVLDTFFPVEEEIYTSEIPIRMGLISSTGSEYRLALDIEGEHTFKISSFPLYDYFTLGSYTLEVKIEEGYSAFTPPNGTFVLAKNITADGSEFEARASFDLYAVDTMIDNSGGITTHLVVESLSVTGFEVEDSALVDQVVFNVTLRLTLTCDSFVHTTNLLVEIVDEDDIENGQDGWTFNDFDDIETYFSVPAYWIGEEIVSPYSIPRFEYQVTCLVNGHEVKLDSVSYSLNYDERTGIEGPFSYHTGRSRIILQGEGVFNMPLTTIHLVSFFTVREDYGNNQGYYTAVHTLSVMVELNDAISELCSISEVHSHVYDCPYLMPLGDYVSCNIAADDQTFHNPIIYKETIDVTLQFDASGELVYVITPSERNETALNELATLYNVSSSQRLNAEFLCHVDDNENYFFATDFDDIHLQQIASDDGVAKATMFLSNEVYLTEQDELEYALAPTFSLIRLHNVFIIPPVSTPQFSVTCSVFLRRSSFE